MKNHIALKSTSFMKISIPGALIISMITFAMGCENGDSPSSAATVQTQKSAKSTTISGLVRNSKGPIKSGKIVARDTSGRTAATGEWNDNAPYSIKVPAGTSFPIVLSATVNPGKSESQLLQVVVINPALTTNDITQITTAIAKKAKSLGGYSAQNLMQATLSTTAAPEGDKTVGGFKGDPTKRFGGWH